MEIWKDIPGYEGLYQVSSEGSVKSLERDTNDTLNHRHRIRHYKNKILKAKAAYSGHLYIDLCKNSKVKRFYIHRLVAELFVPNPNGYNIVHHIDHNPQNNRIENLVWVSEVKHKSLHHNTNGGEAGRLCKEVFQYNLNGELVAVWESTKEAARETGSIQGAISRCCNNKQTQHKGYRWSYVPL